MSAELVPINNDIAAATDRRAALERLNVAAETASTPQEARAIQLQASTASDLLKSIQAPFEDARQAAKASVLAARRLGRMLADVSAQPSYPSGKGAGKGSGPSERGLVVKSLGMSKVTASYVIRLSRVVDADFQRYIQDETKIPSINGALSNCSIDYRVVRERHWKNGVDSKYDGRRRQKAGVRKPAHPSLDEGYSLLVLAIGHISERVKGSPKRRTAIGAALSLMYEAEDLLKPYRAGYGE